MGLAG
ncbi:hypothetical protein YPPY25_4524, partial [Yersinia pestis PY-25]|jgi:hypothetical protein